MARAAVSRTTDLQTGRHGWCLRSPRIIAPPAVPSSDGEGHYRGRITSCYCSLQMIRHNADDFRLSVAGGQSSRTQSASGDWSQRCDIDQLPWVQSVFNASQSNHFLARRCTIHCFPWQWNNLSRYSSRLHADRYWRCCLHNVIISLRAWRSPDALQCIARDERERRTILESHHIFGDATEIFCT